MSTRYPRVSSTIIAAALVMAASAAAQTTDPGEIQRHLKTGDIIAIHTLDGIESRGKVAGISNTVIEILPILPGDAANTYLTSSTAKNVPIDQIAAVNRVDPFGANPEPVFQRSGSFGTLPQRLQPGETVRVTERSGATTLGKVTGVSTSSLVINVRKDNPRDGTGRARHEWDAMQTFTPATVATIERPAPIWDGAVKGAAVAALATWLAATSICRYDCVGLPGVYVFTVGIGAGVGLGIDALFPAKRLYRAPK